MRKGIMIFLAMALILATTATRVSGQAVLMNSAETINQGNLKLAIFPTVLFAKNGGESVWGVAGRFGYGLTPRFDIEAKAGIFKGLKYFGVDIEYWLVKWSNFYVSLALGGHMTNVNGPGDSSGFDTAILASSKPVNNLEVYGGLMLAFDSIKNSDNNYTLAHFVPGIEYRISDDIDFLAEVGIALNDHSRSYGSIGLAFYFLR